MNIEKMKIEDFESINRLWSNCHGITLRAIDDSREGIARFLNRNPHNNFICKIKGRIVGAILCGHDGRKGFIYHTVVDKDYRNKGIAKQLVNAAVSSLKEEAITKVALLVNADNPSGNTFWESLGFDFHDDLNYRILILDERNL